MISLGARAVRAILRLYTYPYRKNHQSLSRSIKFRQKPYRPPGDRHYAMATFSGTRVEILTPLHADENLCIVQFHGGGHTQPMNGMYRKAAERLCKIANCAVYSIDYSVGAELVYPAVHDACYFAYVDLYERELKGKRIVAIGDSFGANLMLSTCLRLRGADAPLPNALIAVSCFIDLAASGDSYRKNCYTDPLYSLPKYQRFEENERFIRRKTPYSGKTSPLAPLLSPAYAEYAGFPDLLILCGDRETSESDNDMLYRKAKSAGVNVTLKKYGGMWHDFPYLTPFLKESKAAWRKIGEFILRQK